MEEEIIKKIALLSGKKRISPQTGFLHCWSEDPYLASQDAIPIVENFIYAYALFRSKTVENIQEGKAFLEKLLAFEVNGNFPVYLHEFPQCKDSRLSSHLLPVIFYLFKDFSSALGEVLRVKLQALSERIILLLQSQESFSMASKGRVDAFLGRFDPSHWTPKSPEEWGEFCLCCQMADLDFPQEKILWNSSLGVFVGDSKERHQEGHEPAVTFFDLFMETYAKRALLDHPIHLKAALVHPWKKRGPKTSDELFVSLVNAKQRQPLTFYWGGLDRLHSLVLEAKKGTWLIEPSSDGFICTYEYDENVPSEEEGMEFAFYLDDAKEHSILVEGQKATMFHPKDEVSILSKDLKISFQVQVDSSLGTFTGHISKGDRTYQKSKTLPYGGYDWKLGWRTLKREPKVALKLFVKISKN